MRVNIFRVMAISLFVYSATGFLYLQQWALTEKQVLEEGNSFIPDKWHGADGDYQLTISSAMRN